MGNDCMKWESLFLTNFTSHMFVWITLSRYIHTIYLGEKCHYRGNSLYNPATPYSSMCLGDGSYTSHSVYLRTTFMTVIVVHPEAIIRG